MSLTDSLPGIPETRISLEDALAKPDQALWVVVRKNASKTLPEALRKLVRVRVIEAEGCELKEIPEWIAELTELRHLKLDKNKLTTLPKSIGRLTRLRWLGLTQNALTSLPEELGQLTELSALWVDHNPKLSQLPQSLFALSKLALLDITNTKIKNIQPLSGLETLEFAKTPLASDEAALKEILKQFPKARREDTTIEIDVPQRKAKPPGLSRAELVSAIAGETIEDRANLDGVTLDGERFTKIALKGQSLRKADLSKSQWSNCVFSVDLRDANLEGAVFEDCLFSGDYERLSLAGARAKGAIFRRCRLANLSFEKANLQDASLQVTIEYSARLEQAEARGLRLHVTAKSVQIYAGGADLRDAIIEGECKSSSVLLAKADLRGANLSALVTDKIDLQNAKTDSKTQLASAPAPVADAKPLPVKAVKAIKAKAPTALKLSWAEEMLGSEGGPLMIAPLSVVANWGGSVIREGEHESDYDVLLRRMKGELHFSREGALFWEAEPGQYAIGIGRAGEELVLLEPADADELGEAQAACEAARNDKARGELASDGKGLVALWSPSARTDLHKLDKVATLAPARLLALRESRWAYGIGMQAGNYAVTTGHADGHRWLRLSRR